MRRFYTEPENISGNVATIFEDASHITKVLRMEPGEKILLFDGTGVEYVAVLTELDAKSCRAEIIERKISEQEPEIKITIFQGIPKSGKMEAIIQKSVELGVTGIVPTAMERCVAKLDNGKKEAERIKRWNKVSLEAAKQCGRGLVPVVESSISFSDVLDRLDEFDLVIMPYEELGHAGECTLRKTLAVNDFKSIGVLIGPEGGFSEREAERAASSGVKLVGLGKRILRTETVAAAITSVIMYEKGEM